VAPRRGTIHVPAAVSAVAIRTRTTCPTTAALHLASWWNPLVDLGVVDVGDIEMPSGDTELSMARLEEAVAASPPLASSLSSRWLITPFALPDVTGRCPPRGRGASVGIHFPTPTPTP